MVSQSLCCISAWVRDKLPASGTRAFSGTGAANLTQLKQPSVASFKQVKNTIERATMTAKPDIHG